MKNRASRNLCYVGCAVLVIYLGGYLWLRHTSVDNKAVPHTEISFAFLQSDLHELFSRSPDRDKIKRIQRRIRLLRTIYHPAGWIDERVTGATIDTQTDW